MRAEEILEALRDGIEVINTGKRWILETTGGVLSCTEIAKLESSGAVFVQLYEPGKARLMLNDRG